MSQSNKEMQLRKTCKLYAYLLVSQAKEVPESIQECADSQDYDYLVDCVSELSKAIKDLDSETFDTIVNNTDSSDARELLHWWNMYQMYIPLPS